MRKRYYTNFEFYYDENTMDIPQHILESEQLSDAAKNIFVPLPPLEEQQEIVRILDEILEKEIMNTNSIAVHFRKGDYVDFGFEVLTETYYHKAIEYMSVVVEHPRFFVFSDDIESAQRVIGQKDNYIYVKGNKGNDSYIDMQLMSLCKHNIIANSTFSFWGAYLNINPGKKVIYPTTPLRGCRYPYADTEWVGIS